MPNENVALAVIKVNGSPLSTAVMNNLLVVEVDSSLHMPAAATIEFRDENLSLTDSQTLFTIGADLVISMMNNTGVTSVAQTQDVFVGVIAAIEPVYMAEDLYTRLVIRAYDRLHLLHRGASSATYLNMKDSDLVSPLVGSAGLSAQATATTIVHEHIYRDDCSDYDFLKMLAARNGFVVVCEGRTVKFAKPADLGRQPVTLQFGEQLREFRPALSLVGQVDEVIVGGWDRAQKQAVSAQTKSATFSETKTGLSRGPAIMQAAHSTRKLHVTEITSKQPVAAADGKALFDKLAAGDLTAEGVAYGNPKIAPGTKLTLQKLGSRFSGTYFVTRVRHRLDPGSAYTTEFWVGGMSSGTLASLLTPPRALEALPKPSGLYPAIVTNAKDESSQGRVKVKFPQISDQIESTWAPVVSVGAGNQRGLWVLPEVNDEVLVGFLHGDINHPVVLGGMWNGKDQPPDASPTGSTIDVRTFKTRAGHILRFTDKQGEEKIELIDKTKNNKIVIDSKQESISILATKNISIESKSGDITLKGINVKMEGTASLEAEGKSKIALKGGLAELSATGQTKVSGAMVMIN